MFQYLLCLSLIGTLFPLSVSAQMPRTTYIGNGLVVFKAGITGLLDYHSISFFADSLLVDSTNISIENTTCPKCMACAEPVAYYQGPIEPFICGVEGMCFITTSQGTNWREIIIDKKDKRVFIENSEGTFYSWRSWLLLQGKLGEYLTLGTMEKDLVLYKKLLIVNQSEKPINQVDLKKIKDVEELKFIPVDVQGNWMKLKMVNSRKKIEGTCWMIWNDGKNWTFGFKWHAD